MFRSQNRTTKTTLRTERCSALKKDLTGPTLLEMSGKPTNQELGSHRALYPSTMGLSSSHYVSFGDQLFIEVRDFPRYNGRLPAEGE